MFALKALAMSLLNVARAGKWRRPWKVTAVRTGVAFVPAALAAWMLGWVSGADGVGGFARTLGLLAVPVAVYLGLCAGFLVDHVIGRIGALMTWVVHLAWSLLSLALVGSIVLVVLVFIDGPTPEFVALWILVLLWSPAYVTVAFVLGRLVPGSFPKPKPWHENVQDIRAAYRRLRQRRAGRSAAKALEPPKPSRKQARAERPRKPSRGERRRALGDAVVPGRPELPPGAARAAARRLRLTSASCRCGACASATARCEDMSARRAATPALMSSTGARGHGGAKLGFRRGGDCGRARRRHARGDTARRASAALLRPEGRAHGLAARGVVERVDHRVGRAFQVVHKR